MMMGSVGDVHRVDFLRVLCVVLLLVEVSVDFFRVFCVAMCAVARWLGTNPSLKRHPVDFSIDSTH